MYEGLGQYISMTSPYGGDDGDGGRTQLNRNIGKDEPGALVAIGNALGSPQRVTIDQVPLDVRDLLY